MDYDYLISKEVKESSRIMIAKVKSGEIKRHLDLNFGLKPTLYDELGALYSYKEYLKSRNFHDLMNIKGEISNEK